MALLRCDSCCVCLYSLMSYWLWFPSTSSNAAITWTQPPPPYTPSDISDTRTAYQVKLVNGSAVERLTWNYTLTGETLSRITWVKDGVLVGIKRASGSISIVPIGKGHFNISSTDPATLIIYDLTEDDEALFSCKVETETPNEWTDNIQVNVQVKTKLTNVSDSQVECEGFTVTLFCEATGKPQPNITWTRVLDNGSDGEIIQHDTSPVLVLSNIQRNQSGTYRCTAYNGVGRSFNQTMNVTVDFSPSIGPLADLAVHEEQPVSQSCNVSAIPSASVRWIRPSGDVLEASSITLVQILRNQSGEYICEASNRCGNVNESVFITVEYKPENVELQITPAEKVCKDSMITLNCSVDAVPAVHTYQLFQNDILLENSSSGNFSRNMSMEGNFTLKCAAINTVGSANSSSHAFVVNVPSKVASLASVTYEEGESFNVTCMVTGSPAPDVVWVDVKTGNRTSGNVLNFTSVNRTQDGEYRCEATNECGNNNESVFVIVHYPPKIVTTSVDQTVNENDTVTLNCTADGKPPAVNITWTRLFDSSSVSFPLTITGKQDEGFYRCTASNGVGNPATKDVFIAVENFHPFGTQVMTTLQNNATVVNDTFNVTCTAVANPPAKYMIYKDDMSLINITSHPAVLETSVTERVNQARYKCVPFNSFGPGPEKEITIAVHYPPTIATISGNQTVNESDTVPLNCTADGKPPANITWTRVFDSSSVSFALTITGKQDEGFYRCTASNGVGNPATKDVFIAVENFHPYGTQVNTTLQNNATVVNDTFNVTCSAEANPPAEYMIYKDDMSVINTTSHPAVLETSVTESVNQTRYKCVPFNRFGPGPEKEITIEVHYKPGNVSLVSNVSENKVCLGDTVSFTCTADANPDVHSYLLHENQTMIESKSGKWQQRLSTSGHYYYSCVVNNSVGSGHSAIVTITVNVPPSTDSIASITVIEGSSLSLTCNSSGIPPPSVKWRDRGGEEENAATWIITNISRTNDGEYKCEATNECSTSTTSAVVTVHYPPSITEPQGATIEWLVNTIVEIPCKATGNPKPNVYWTNRTTGSDGILRFNPFTESDNGSVYTCTADNGVKPADSVSIFLIVGVSEATITIRFPAETCVVAFKDVQNAESVKFIVRITSALLSVEIIQSTVNEIQVIELSCRNGSVVADVRLNFSRIVSVQSVISALKAAARNGSLGDLTVDPDSIVQTPEPTTPPPTTTPTESPKLEMWHFIVIVVGALVALILVVVIVAFWFNKRRKCRKDTRVHDNEDATADQQPLQELRKSGTEENAYDRVNHGYSESGPTPSSENAQGAASAADVPAYAVVDKSQRKGKKEKQQEIAPDSQNVTYAVVDKSTKKKKKKKNEKPEDMYAQVDRSKKTKPPKNPGDVLYADLGDFHARGNMPPVATSPEPLPPIKMPTSYEKTEYADITQFLKGDATLPQSVDTSEAAKADQGQSHPPMDSTQAAGGATGANNVSKL